MRRAGLVAWRGWVRLAQPGSLRQSLLGFVPHPGLRYLERRGRPHGFAPGSTRGVAAVGEAQVAEAAIVSGVVVVVRADQLAESGYRQKR